MNAELTRQKETQLLYALKNAKMYHLSRGVSADEYRDLIESRPDEPKFVQKQIWLEIAVAAKKKEVGRQLTDMVKPKDNSVQIDIDPDEGTLAPDVAEGGEIPIKTEQVTSIDISCFKIGTRPVITMEQIEDSLFNSVGRQLRLAGRRVALREDSIIMRRVRNNSSETILTVADSSSTNNVDTSGTLTDNQLSSCIDKIQTDGFDPDWAAFHTNLMADVRTETAFASNAGWPKGSTGVMEKGVLDNVWNFQILLTNTGLSATADEIAGVLLDKEAAVRFALRRDTTIKNFEDPIRDLVGMSVTKRLNAGIINEDAVCTIQR